jgi:hypothetical protein
MLINIINRVFKLQGNRICFKSVIRLIWLSIYSENVLLLDDTTNLSLSLVRGYLSAILYPKLCMEHKSLNWKSCHVCEKPLETPSLNCQPFSQWASPLLPPPFNPGASFMSCLHHISCITGGPTQQAFPLHREQYFCTIHTGFTESLQRCSVSSNPAFKKKIKFTFLMANVPGPLKTLFFFVT